MARKRTRRDKYKIRGGMDDKWISKIRRNSTVNKHMREATEWTVKRADSKLNARSRRPWSYHFKWKRLQSRGWGPTFIIFPTSKMARGNARARSDIFGLLSAAGFKKKDGA